MPRVLSQFVLVSLVSLLHHDAFATPPLAASATDRPTSLADAQVQFDFASQDGEENFTCRQELVPSSGDLRVTCDRWSFLVHIRLFIHDRPQAPKRAYELLYWVTDETLLGGKPGEFTGSTFWLNLDEATALSSFDAGQDIENNYVLTAHVKLAPAPGQ